MTAEEVTVVHLAAAEKDEMVLASSSSKVEIVLEKDEKEKQKEDLSNGANVRIVKEDTDGDGDTDGSYVFVSKNDDVNGDPVESDLQKNGNGIGEEDNGFEHLESKGEVKSESDLVKDESRFGVADEDKESIELCHVEGSVDGTKSGDPVESGPVSAINVEDGILETSLADQSEVSKLPEGDLANGMSKHIVSEAAVLVDSSAKKGDEAFSVSVSDRNGDNIAADQNGVSEWADDGLANGISELTVSEAVVDSSAQRSAEISSVSDSNGGSLANDGVENNAAVSGAKEYKDPELSETDIGACSGDGLAVHSVEENLVDFKSKENEDSEMAVSDNSDCNGDCLANDNTKDTVIDTTYEQNRVSELPSDEGVPDVSVSDANGDGFSDVTAKDIVSEAVVVDSSAEQNDGLLVSVPDNCWDGLPTDRMEDPFSEVSKPVSSGNGDVPEQNGFPDKPQTVGNGPVDGGSDLDHNSEKNLSSDADCLEALQIVKTDDGIPETIETKDVDSSQISEQVQPPAIFENAPSIVTDENEDVASERFVNDTTTDYTGASSDAVDSSSFTVTINKSTVESAVSDTKTETSHPSLDDEKVETVETERRAGLGSHFAENSVVETSLESSSVTVSGDIEISNAQGGIQFGSLVTRPESEVRDEVERKRPFHYLMRVPKFDDVSLKEKIRLAEIKVNEKTQSRDAISCEMQSKKATCKDYSNNFDAALSEEKAARDLQRSKRQEIESIQSVMNIEDIDARIRNMEHMIQHETLPLKDEKQFIREIKQLKQSRERLLSNMGRQEEVQQGLDQKDQIEERLKSLKKEADQLKVNVLKAEAVTKAAKKKYHEETEKFYKLKSQFEDANNIRQEAYAQLQSLRKQMNEKNKHYWQYRDDAKIAYNLASKMDKEALQNLCVNQVEKLMDMWNNNDEFRKEYVRCNVRSTLWRLRTLDGRGLGPDEEPPVISQVVNERGANDNTVSSSTLVDQTQEKGVPAKAEKANGKPEGKAVEQKNRTSKSEKSVKSVPLVSGSTTASSKDKIEETGVENEKRTKEEEEMARKAEELRREEARKAEELRREEEAAKKEQLRLEEIAKAKEALERKRRNAERAQARAALRAQKEAEEKEKEREKRAKKKERKMVATVAATGDVSITTDEIGIASTSETPTEPKESEKKEKPVTVARRSQKPSQFTKAKSIPPPLRNRGKRRMQQWMWVLLAFLVIFALFLIGNYNFSFNFGLRKV